MLEKGKLTAQEFLSRLSYDENKIIGKLFEVDTDTNSEDDESVPLSQASTLSPSDGSEATTSTNSQSSTSAASQEPKICCICYVNQPKVLYVPCGHYTACLSCHNGMLAAHEERLRQEEFEDAHPVKKCPLCNQAYDQAVQLDNIY